MRTISRWAAIILFTGFVAAGLTFGVSATLAQPAGATECPIQPPQFLGRCFSLADCKAACQLHGASDGACPSGCCVCYFPAP